MVSMVSKALPSKGHDTNVVVRHPVARSAPNKKNPGKVPRKIHKSEREKLKRDELNDLYSELGNTLELELAQQNSGKASILGGASRIMRDLILQVESLRKENVALGTESHYVNAENNELKDDNSSLQAEISRLHNGLQERQQSDPTWLNNGTITDPALLSHPTSITLPLAQSPVTPLIIIPLHQDLQAFNEPARSSSLPKPSTQVRRPHARYPTPSDAWPLQIFTRHHHSGSSGRSNSGDEGLEKV